MPRQGDEESQVLSRSWVMNRVGKPGGESAGPCVALQNGETEPTPQAIANLLKQ